MGGVAPPSPEAVDHRYTASGAGCPDPEALRPAFHLPVDRTMRDLEGGFRVFRLHFNPTRNNPP